MENLEKETIEGIRIFNDSNFENFEMEIDTNKLTRFYAKCTFYDNEIKCTDFLGCDLSNQDEIGSEDNIECAYDNMKFFNENKGEICQFILQEIFKRIGRDKKIFNQEELTCYSDF